MKPSPAYPRAGNGTAEHQGRSLLPLSRNCLFGKKGERRSFDRLRFFSGDVFTMTSGYRTHCAENEVTGL